MKHALPERMDKRRLRAVLRALLEPYVARVATVASSAIRASLPLLLLHHALRVRATDSMSMRKGKPFANLPPLGRSQIAIEPMLRTAKLENFQLAEKPIVKFARRASTAQRVLQVARHATLVAYHPRAHLPAPRA